MTTDPEEVLGAIDGSALQHLPPDRRNGFLRWRPGLCEIVRTRGFLLRRWEFGFIELAVCGEGEGRQCDEVGGDHVVWQGRVQIASDFADRQILPVVDDD